MPARSGTRSPTSGGSCSAATWLRTSPPSAGRGATRSAGQGARVLVLLQDPSGEAEEGSGFVSKHNNDPTAHNTYIATERAKLGYDISLHWNVVPWWVANTAKPVRSLWKESERAQPYMVELLEMLDPAPTEV